MKRIIFSRNAWEDYTYWQSEDRKILKKINSLIKDIDKNGFIHYDDIKNYSDSF